MFDVSKAEITDESLTRALVLLAVPLLVQNLTQIAQNLVDVFWLGRLGENAVAAAGLNFPVVSITAIVVTVTPLVGTQVLVSQRIGGEDAASARRITVHGVTMGLALGLVVAAAVVAGAEFIVGAFDTGPEVTDLAVAYIGTYALVLPFAGVSDSLEGAFTGWGDSRAALHVTALSVLVNIVLDPVLIFGLGPAPALGIRGAALATVVGSATGLVLALAYAFGPRDSLTLTLADAALDRDTFRELLDVGAPLTGQYLAKDAVRLVMVGIVAAVGGAAGLAAYTIGARIASVAFVPASGLQQAAQSVVGQNLGADKPGRAGRAVWTGAGIAAGALTLVGVGQWLAPGALAHLFVPDISAEALSLTVTYLQILAYGYWAIGASYLFLAGFNGAGETRKSLAVSLVQYWGVRLPIAAVGAYALGMGVEAAFWAVTLSNVAAAVGAGAYYYLRTHDGMLERAAERASSAAAD